MKAALAIGTTALATVLGFVLLRKPAEPRRTSSSPAMEPPTTDERPSAATSADPPAGTRPEGIDSMDILNSAAGLELQGAGGADDQARWARTRQIWAEWWTANRQVFQLRNPYATR